jgi:hypothetical protein
VQQFREERSGPRLPLGAQCFQIENGYFLLVRYRTHCLLKHSQTTDARARLKAASISCSAVSPDKPGQRLGSLLRRSSGKTTDLNPPKLLECIDFIVRYDRLRIVAFVAQDKEEEGILMSQGSEDPTQQWTKFSVY